jgi:hypothetical protein
MTKGRHHLHWKLLECHLICQDTPGRKRRMYEEITNGVPYCFLMVYIEKQVRKRMESKRFSFEKTHEINLVFHL